MKRFFIYASIAIATFTFSACGGSADEKTNDSAAEKISDEKTAGDSKTLTVDEKVEAIRGIFQAIESEKSYKIETKEYRNPSPEMYYDMSGYTTYYKGSELKKLVELGGEEGYTFETSFYFEGGKLVFYYNRESYMDNLYRESRVYLDNDLIIKALVKEKPMEDEKTDLSTMKNSDDPDFAKDAAQFQTRINEHHKSALERLATSTPYKE
jgi:hypothetical protein